MSAQVQSSPPSPSTLPTSLKAERIQLWLREMPGWEVSGGILVQRRFTFRTRSESLSFLRHATRAIEAMEVPFGLRGPTLEYRGDQVTVAIWSNRGSFSGADLELARIVSQPS